MGPARAVCGREAYMVLNATSGYLASVLTEETQAGSIHCPWVIKAKPGQRINITMYDFAVAESTPSLSSFIDPCSVVYATLKEPDITSTATHRLCNSEKRVSHAYESFTDNVEVRIFTEEASPKRKYFLLYYQGECHADWCQCSLFLTYMWTCCYLPPLGFLFIMDDLSWFLI